MKRKCLSLSFCAFMLLSFSLSGCAGQKLSVLTELPESNEIGTEESEKFENDGNATEEEFQEGNSTDEGTDKVLTESESIAYSQLITEDAFVSDLSGTETNKTEIADRILSRFQNQILEWYYSDIHIRTGLPYGKVQNTIRNVDLTPGNKLYYRILSVSGTNLFQIQCSDEDSFEQYFKRDYAYFATTGEITEFDFDKTLDQTIAFGCFIISNTFIENNKQEYQLVNDEFHDLWNEWLSEKSASELKYPLKNAYLMPFSVEEDGSADLCVFLELENGAWIMARPSIIRYYDSDYSNTPKWLFERKVGWNQTVDYPYLWPGYISEEARDFEEEYLLLEGRELTVYRAYEPTESGYTIHSYEAPQNTEWYDSEGNHCGGGYHKSKNGDFLSEIPDLAEEKLY